MANVEFINQIAPLIVAEGRKRGYKVFSTVISQAIIESNFGKSTLSDKYHNYFGLKCGSSWKGQSVNLKTKEEYKVGTLTTIKDNFRVYDDMEGGVKGYYDFISTKRYANLKTAVTYRQYAEMLKADGYATSSSYVNTLCKTVETYNLQKYDSAETVIKTETKPTLMIGSKGEYVLHWQKYLNLLGFACGNEDGIFGKNTRAAVIQYQLSKGLAADGIIGTKTWESVGA